MGFAGVLGLLGVVGVEPPEPLEEELGSELVELGLELEELVFVVELDAPVVVVVEADLAVAPGSGLKGSRAEP